MQVYKREICEECMKDSPYEWCCRVSSCLICDNRDTCTFDPSKNPCRDEYCAKELGLIKEEDQQ